MKNEERLEKNPNLCNNNKKREVYKTFVYLKNKQENLQEFVRENDLTIDENYKKFLELQEVNFKLTLLRLKYNSFDYSSLDKIKENITNNVEVKL